MGSPRFLTMATMISMRDGASGRWRRRTRVRQSGPSNCLIRRWRLDLLDGEFAPAMRLLRIAQMVGLQTEATSCWCCGSTRRGRTRPVLVDGKAPGQFAVILNECRSRPGRLPGLSNDAGRAIRRRRKHALSIDVRLGTRDRISPNGSGARHKGGFQSRRSHDPRRRWLGNCGQDGFPQGMSARAACHPRCG